jgi:hypothetical protein
VTIMRELTSSDIIEIAVVTAVLIALWFVNRMVSRAETNLERAGESFGRKWRLLFGRLGGPPMVARGPGAVALMGAFGYLGYISWKLFESRASFYICITLGGLQLLPVILSIFQSMAPAVRFLRTGATRFFSHRDNGEGNQP